MKDDRNILWFFVFWIILIGFLLLTSVKNIVDNDVLEIRQF